MTGHLLGLSAGVLLLGALESVSLCPLLFVLLRLIRSRSTSSQCDATAADRGAGRHLMDSEAFLERVEEISGVGGFVVDLSSGLQRWTRQTYRIYELDEGSALTPELLRTLLPSTVNTHLHSGTGCDLELPIVTVSGRPIWIRLAAAVEYERGTPARLVGAVQDITERRLMDQQLRDATAAAQNTNRAKSEFLANMSHEIRTPLNAVIGLSYLLQQTTLSEDQQQFLRKIQLAGRALLGVVNNVLDLSKIEAGEMLLENVPFSLPELLGDVGQMLAPEAAARGLALNVLTASDLPHTVTGDASRLRQILTNLVHNALKFTEAGRVTLDVSLAHSAPDHIRLRCAVTDTGIGIDPATLARLFIPFTQATASTTRRFGGTGLGLSIVRRFVELMGGEIGVTSTLNAGSRFWVEIPFQRPAELEDAAPLRRANGPHLLVADSQAAAPDSLTALVRALGWGPQVVDSRDALLQFVEDTATDFRPDVLILSSRLLESQATAPPSTRLEQVWPRLPPVIVVSEEEQHELRPPTFMRPEDVELLRPVRSTDLFKAINAAYRNRHEEFERLSQVDALDEQDSQCLLGVHVLAVDDSEINLEVLRHILERHGALVATCSDGADALEYVRAHQRQLDLVLMDVRMPLLDGNEVARRIREDLKLRSLPILALTAGALLGERQRCLEAGMNDFVSKPFDPTELLRKLRWLVQPGRGAPIPGEGADALSFDQADSAFWSALPSLDTELLRRTYGDEVDLVLSLLVRLLHEYADFEQSLVAPDDDLTARDELRQRVHRLKGSAGLLGATQLMQRAAAVEAALQDGCEGQMLQPALSLLRSALCVLREEARLLTAQPVARPANNHPKTTGCPPLDQDIAHLCDLLDQQDLQAIDRFHGLVQSSHELPQMAEFERVREAIENLQFTTASAQLRLAWTRRSASSQDAVVQ